MNLVHHHLEKPLTAVGDGEAAQVARLWIVDCFHRDVLIRVTQIYCNAADVATTGELTCKEVAKDRLLQQMPDMLNCIEEVVFKVRETCS